MADDPATLTDDQLLALAERAGRGDRAAAADLLRGLQDTIYRFALAQLRDPDAAAEATQETGLRLLKGVRRFERRSRVTTWALGVTLNVCRERRRQRRELADTDTVAETPESRTGDNRAACPLEHDEETQRLRTALDNLPARQREAVVLRYFEELSVADTAEAMGCSSGAVKASVWQALRRLRSLLGETAVRNRS